MNCSAWPSYAVSVCDPSTATCSQSIRSVEGAPTRPPKPARPNACGAELEVPALSRYALAGSPPFARGHVRLRIPICQARREPILRRALPYGLNLLDRFVGRRRIGKLGRHIDENAQNE